MRFRELLDGTWYGFRLAYNTRMRWWVLDLASADGRDLVLGMRVVVGCSLLAPFRRPELPPGDLFAVDAIGEDQDPERWHLQSRVELVYRPIADVIAARGTASEVR